MPMSKIFHQRVEKHWTPKLKYFMVRRETVYGIQVQFTTKPHKHNLDNICY